MTIKDTKVNSNTKPKKSRAINDDEVKTICSNAGKFGWLDTETTPLDSCKGSVALQGGKDISQTVQATINTRKVSPRNRNEHPTSITSITLDSAIIYTHLDKDYRF